MIITHRDKRIKLLGDTHLGRTFINNVPLHRRGDREQMIKDQFVRELNPEGCDTHIHMGDLFDKAKVSLETIMHAALSYIAEACVHNTQFWILQGNHDKSRDLEAISAFDIFRQIVAPFQNINVVTRPAIGNGILLSPWDPLLSAQELLSTTQDDIELAFGHWDVDLRSDLFNLIPTATLAARGVKRAFTGHVHLPDQFSRDGVDVTVVGSMQPYAHGEDADGSWYVTLSLDEAKQREDLINKCVRIDLKPGEVFDLDIDCLQLQVRPPEQQEAENIDVKFGDFNLMNVFDEVSSEFDIPSTIISEMRTRCVQLFTQ